MEPVWQALQESGFGAHVRNSVWLYPVANVLHVLAVMGFFALVAMMDARLIAGSAATGARDMVRRLRPWALALFLLIAATGFILLTPEAVPIATNPAFQLKALALLLALVNVAVNMLLLRRPGEVTMAARVTAVLSLILWLGVAALGRSIAYF
jgi:hypothetical protein